MSNPVVDALTAGEPEQITSDPVNSELDAIKKQKALEAAKKAEYEQRVQEEAGHQAYLMSVKIDEVEEEVKPLVEGILSSKTMHIAEKRERVEQFISLGKIKSVLKKIAPLGFEQKNEINTANLSLLERLAQKEGEALTRSDMDRAADAVSAVFVDLERIGKKAFSLGMGDLDLTRMSAVEKHRHEAVTYVDRIEEDRRKILKSRQQAAGVLYV
ncbi:MAG: hypothetical protein ACRCVN_05935 [Spirochaetia bacterium]